MSTIERYVIVDEDDNEGETDYDTFEQAREAAWMRQFQSEVDPKPQFAVVARIFEYTDSELVWATDGSDIWPPEKEAK